MQGQWPLKRYFPFPPYPKPGSTCLTRVCTERAITNYTFSNARVTSSEILRACYRFDQVQMNYEYHRI